MSCAGGGGGANQQQQQQQHRGRRQRPSSPVLVCPPSPRLGNDDNDNDNDAAGGGGTGSALGMGAGAAVGGAIKGRVSNTGGHVSNMGAEGELGTPPPEQDQAAAELELWLLSEGLQG